MMVIADKVDSQLAQAITSYLAEAELNLQASTFGMGMSKS